MQSTTLISTLFAILALATTIVDAQSQAAPWWPTPVWKRYSSVYYPTKWWRFNCIGGKTQVCKQYYDPQTDTLNRVLYCQKTNTQCPKEAGSKVWWKYGKEYSTKWEGEYDPKYKNGPGRV